jgi:diadenosine tetraphosphatase ApaH/serine/threonine PP2A family protein phosphatase
VLHLTPPGANLFSNFHPESGTKYLLNPGSIGQPRDGDPRAGFAIADIDSQSVEFWRVAYDIEAVQQRMRMAKLPEALVLRLSFGR